MQPRFRTKDLKITRLQSKVRQLEHERSEERRRRGHTLPYMAVVSLNMMTNYLNQFEEDEQGESINETKLTLDKFHRYIMQYINAEREREI